MVNKVRILRTNSENSDFIKLVKELDAYLAICDGDEHEFYDQFNKLDNLKNVILVYEEELPVGCGAIKKYSDNVVEIKRMYVMPESRNNGYASRVLSELEIWAKELNYKKCILETGKRQVEAVSFYTKNEYSIIPNFGPYIGVDNSLCFKKELYN